MRVSLRYIFRQLVALGVLMLIPLLVAVPGSQLHAALAPAPVVETIKAESPATVLTPAFIRENDNREIAERLGRKLSFRERMAMGLLRGKLKRAERRAARGKATRDGAPIVALALAILGLAFPLLSFVALLIAGPARVRNRGVDEGRYRMANWAYWIGIGTIVIYLILGIYALANFISTGTGG